MKNVEYAYVVYDNYDEITVGIAKDFEDLCAAIMNEAYVSLVERMEKVDEGYWHDVAETLSKELADFNANYENEVIIDGGTANLEYVISKVPYFDVIHNL